MSFTLQGALRLGVPGATAFAVDSGEAVVRSGFLSFVAPGCGVWEQPGQRRAPAGAMRHGRRGSVPPTTAQTDGGHMVKSRTWLAAAAALVMVTTGCGEVGGAESGPLPSAEPGQTTAVADLPRERTDVPYVQGAADAQKLDLTLPTTEAAGPYPVLVWVHGGRWREGDKNQIDDTEQKAATFKQALLEGGYAVASINYRLVPESRFPSQLHDVNAAIRFLKAHADQLGVDAERVAVGGESAGGHLAALAGLAASDPQADPSILGDLPVGGDESGARADGTVDAILGYYGQYDLRTRGADRAAVAACGDGNREGRDGIDSSEGQLLNADPASPEGQKIAGEASPVEYVSAQAPATFLIAGRQDCSAPYVAAERLGAMLQQTGAPVEVKVIDAEHGASLFYDQPDTNQQVIDFLNTHLTD